MKLTDKQKNGIRLAAHIFLSVALIVTGILFMYSCYTVYKLGPSPFTRESISSAFSRIEVAVWITLAAVIIAATVNIIFSVEEKKLVGFRSPKLLNLRLASGVDTDTAPDNVKAKLEKERRLRGILHTVRLSLNILSAFLPLIYLLNPANFPANSGQYNAEISHGMLVYLAFLAPVAVFEVVWVILSDISYRRENEVLKEAIKLLGVSKTAKAEKKTKLTCFKNFIKENENPITLGVRIAFVGCAIVFIIVGIANGGMADVLNKAINICTECIGLG